MEVCLLQQLWQEVLEIWPRVRAQAPSQRAEYLRQVCADRDDLRSELENLLAADDRAGTFLEYPLIAPATDPPSSDKSRPPTSWLGQRLGPFELRQVLGQGGMGTVYLGRRVDGEMEQEVAVKVLRDPFQGTSLEHRFRTERQILARLQHPNIARLLDVGTASNGVPWVALEFIRGEPITQFCDRLSLGTADRLRLMVGVCEAVEAAHQQNIVHRDLKPDNILVTDTGEPKLLDFGIAKLLDGVQNNRQTTIGLMMTPSFASPEQLAEQSATPASDVYSLGVLLYLLTTRQMPFDWLGNSALEIQRRMRARTVARPSSQLAESSAATWRLKDLDTVILKALAFEPDRRYLSATELRHDLQRYLARQPIQARPPSQLGRAGKWLARHRTLAAWLATFAIGTVALLWRFTDDAAQQTANAEMRLQTDQLILFLQDTFAEADPYVSSESLQQMRTSLDAHVARVDDDLQGLPGLQSRLLGSLGEIYHRLGLHDQAQELLQRSLTLSRQAFGRQHPERAMALKRLALLSNTQGKHQTAEDMLARALSIENQISETPNLAAAETLHSLGSVEVARGDYSAGRQYFERALAIRRDSAEPLLVAKSMASLGNALLELGQLEAAEMKATEALQIAESVGGTESLAVAEYQCLLADIASQQLEHTLAKELFERALPVLRARLGASRPSVGAALNNLAGVLHSLSLNRQAEQTYEEALAIQRASLGDHHAQVATTLTNVGLVLRNRGDLAAAQERYEEALKIFRQLVGDQHPSTAMAATLLGQIQRTRGLASEAEELARLAVAALEHQLGTTHSRLVTPLVVLGSTRMDQQDFAGADFHFNRALAIAEERNGEKIWLNASVLGRQARLEIERGDLQRAEEIYNTIRQALQLAPQHWQGKGQHSLNMRLADLYLQSGRLAEAKLLLQTSPAELRKLLPANHSLLIELRSIEGAAKVAMGDLEAGQELLESSHVELVERLGYEAPATRQARARLRQLSAIPTNGA